MHSQPSLAQLVERRTVVVQSILRSLVRIRQLGSSPFFFNPQKIDWYFYTKPPSNGFSSFRAWYGWSLPFISQPVWIFPSSSSANKKSELFSTHGNQSIWWWVREANKQKKNSGITIVVAKIVLSACLIGHNYKEKRLPMSNYRGFR